MMMFRRIHLSILIFLSLNRFGFSEERYAGASLELGVGARPLSIGGAAVTMHGAIDGFYYNPAAIAYIERPTLSLMYAPTFGSVASPMANYHYLGAAYPLPAGAVISVNWTRFSVDDIPLYPKLRGDSFAERLTDINLRPDGVALGYFKDIEDVYYFSFARTFHINLPLGWLFVDLPVEIPVGVNLKLIRQSLYTGSASGSGLDLGTMIKFNMGRLFDVRSLGDLTFGFSALDVANTPLLWNTRHENRIRKTTMIGLSYKQSLGFKSADMTLYWTQRKKYERIQLFGLEFSVPHFALRAGYNGHGLSTGAGISFWRFRFDYAFTTLDFENVHRLGCTFNL